MSDYTPTTDEIIAGKVHLGDNYWRELTEDDIRRGLAEHDRQVAERAWDRCVGEMPIDPDWKNFYSDQNPYTKGEQK